MAILSNPRNLHLNGKSFCTLILSPVHVYSGGLLAFLEVETLKDLTLKSFPVVRRAQHIEKNRQTVQKCEKILWLDTK